MKEASWIQVANKARRKSAEMNRTWDLEPLWQWKHTETPPPPQQKGVCDRMPAVRRALDKSIRFSKFCFLLPLQLLYFCFILSPAADHYSDRSAENCPPPASGSCRQKVGPLLGVRCCRPFPSHVHLCSHCSLAGMHLVCVWTKLIYDYHFCFNCIVDKRHQFIAYCRPHLSFCYFVQVCNRQRGEKWLYRLAPHFGWPIGKTL